MKITKMLMLEVGTFNDVYQRPYQSFVDGKTMQQLQESTNYGRNLTPAALGAVGADIMRISSTVTGNVEIANGFDTGRLCVMMEVEFPGTGGVVAVEWLLGFTNHVGVNAMFGNSNLSFDPNMEIYFNNVMRGRKVDQMRSFGRQQVTGVSGAYQLINGDFKPQLTNLHQAPHLMRPQDVFTSMSMHKTRSLLGEDVLDVRPTHGPEKVAVSDRRNTIPGQYLSRVLETWKHQITTDDVDPGALHSQMAASVAEPSIARVRSLQQLATMSELRQGGCVTWRELCNADDLGRLEDRTMVVLAQSAQNRAKLAVRGGETEYWNGNGMNTLIASQFVQAVPGMMMNLMLTELDFSVTNQTLDGSWDVVFQNVQSFNDGDNIDQVQAFEYRLKNELMPGLSRGGDIPMEIHASFNVVGQTFIQISLDGEGFTPYMAPSFCDGLFAAVRAPDTNTLERFADQVGKIMTNLEQDFSAGGHGYEPENSGSFNFLNAQGNKYENSGSL